MEKSNAGPARSFGQIVIVGAGAMGCYFAGRIAEAQAGDVVLVEADPERVAAINREGVRLIDRDGTRAIAVHALTPAALSGEAALLLCFTKAVHTHAALKGVAHVIGAQSWVMTLQNGLGNVENIAQVVDLSRILAGVTDVPADFTPPATVHSPGSGAIRFWHAADGDGEMPRIVEALFRAAGFAATADRQAKLAIWEKLVFNAALNATTATLRQPVGSMDNEDGRALIAMIVGEAVAVAGAAGVAVDRKRIDAMIDNALATHRDHQPSMLQDVLAGRETEIDSINGAITVIGTQLGVRTPVNTALTRLVKLQRQAGPH